MIKIYTDNLLLKDEKKNHFFPLLHELIYYKDSVAQSVYSFVSEVSQADVVILPLAINYLLETKQKKTVDLFFLETSKHKKPLWVYSSGDIGLSIKKNNVYVFRLCDFKSSKNCNSIIMPVFINDPYKTIYDTEKITYQSKAHQPHIGYVGHAKGGFVKLITSSLVFLKENSDIFRKIIISDYCKFYLSSHVRLKYLKKIQNSNAVVSNFIFRDKYRAGVKNEQQKINTTKEFFDNIKNSQYIFCMRGGGNFSVRLYETLAMGRIPLFIDTDCVLPLDKIINWRKHLAYVETEEHNKIIPKLIDFDSALSESKFIDIQKTNRKLWEDYLTRGNFFIHIHSLFIQNKL